MLNNTSIILFTLGFIIFAIAIVILFFIIHRVEKRLDRIGKDVDKKLDDLDIDNVGKSSNYDKM